MNFSECQNLNPFANYIQNKTLHTISGVRDAFKDLRVFYGSFEILTPSMANLDPRQNRPPPQDVKWASRSSGFKTLHFVSLCYYDFAAYSTSDSTFAGPPYFTERQPTEVYTEEVTNASCGNADKQMPCHVKKRRSSEVLASSIDKVHTRIACTHPIDCCIDNRRSFGPTVFELLTGGEDAWISSLSSKTSNFAFSNSNASPEIHNKPRPHEHQDTVWH